MKKLIYLFLAVAFIYSCGNTGQNEENVDTADSTATASNSEATTIADFLSTSEQWADKEIKLKGTVSHTCRHSGKKMFIFGEDQEKTVKINAGGESPAFDVSLEGSDVIVTGKVVEDMRVDEEYLTEWENEIKQAIADEKIKVCNEESTAAAGQIETEETDVDEDDPYATIKEMRKKLEKSGKAYISVYAIDCKTVKEI